jgi:hypothetical protein
VNTVVFIGAVGRSGTTLIERTLATSPRVVALGEVVHLWSRSVRDNEPCGCGEAFADCPFWRAVGEHAFGGWDRIDLPALMRDRHTVDRNRYIPFLIAPGLAPRRFREAYGRHTGLLERLYDGIGAVASEDRDQTVLIDSSKHPSYLFLLRGLRNSRVLLLHVIRDPRGVAFSWSKRVQRPESSQTTMERLGIFRASARWLSHNVLFQLASLAGVQRQQLLYDTFTSDPSCVGTAVDRLVDHRASPAIGSTIDVDGAIVQLGVDHTISGNPLRFADGALEVRSDENWTRTMPRVRRWTVTAFTWPIWQIYKRSRRNLDARGSSSASG